MSVEDTEDASAFEAAERLRIAAWLRKIAPQFWNGQMDCDPDDLAECLETNNLREDWGPPSIGDDT